MMLSAYASIGVLSRGVVNIWSSYQLCLLLQDDLNYDLAVLGGIMVMQISFLRPS